MKPRPFYPPRWLTLTGFAIGLLGGLAATAARELPSDQDLTDILAGAQIDVETRYLLTGVESDFTGHAVCRCGPWLDASQIPPLLKDALLAQEDAPFDVHSGVDWIGLGLALVAPLSGGTVQSGSTLTLRLAKNLVAGDAGMGLAGLARKIREVLVARRIEGAMTRDEILAAYLNQMDFGSTGGFTAFGVAQAAHRYFNKPVKELSLYESALLVGMLRGPRLYNPVTNPEAAGREARAVLDRMLAQGRITPDMHSRALGQAGALPRGPFPPIPVATGYYVAWAYPELAAIAAAHPRERMLRFVVGLDPRLQAQADATIRDEVKRNGRRHVSQGALVAIEGDGRVVALVGGVDFASNQRDRARTMRPPGSAIRLIIYTAALSAGLGPGSIRLDERIPVNGHVPENADGKFLGPIPLTRAFALSRNPVALQLWSEVGADAVIGLARELGVRSPLDGRNLSLALGTSRVTLLEMTAAYVPFMTDGRPVIPYAARMALDARGEVVWRRDQTPLPPVVSASTLRAMRRMLEAVVKEGTGKQALLHGGLGAGKTGGKTGTSQDDRDAWFIGFTERLTTGVWFGNDDDSPMADVAGGGMPALAWRAFNEAPAAQPFPYRRPDAFMRWEPPWERR